ncbi:hypothetical protein ACWGMW_28930 [Streptomyces albidoflavus]
MNLLAIHTVFVDTQAAATCTCPRAACGCAASGPGIPATDCPAPHGAITTRMHQAIDCPALPADTDLSALWIVTVMWTATGPYPAAVTPFDRGLLAELRRAASLWELSEGATAQKARDAWQTRTEASRAANARLHADAAHSNHRTPTAHTVLSATGGARRVLLLDD